MNSAFVGTSEESRCVEGMVDFRPSKEPTVSRVSNVCVMHWMMHRVEGWGVVHRLVAGKVCSGSRSSRIVVVARGSQSTGGRLVLNLGRQMMITAQVEAPRQEPVDGEGVGSHGSGRDAESHIGSGRSSL